MQLSKRLTKVASMVTAGNRLADVGTDHGYVPIYLCERKLIPSAIAIDVNAGPIERAREHVQDAGLSEYIELRLANGLTGLQPGEADTVLISGMGGLLTEKILGERIEILPTFQELILQPQSEIADVRQWLQIKGWQIVCEDIVYESGKFYPMMKFKQGPYRSYTVAEYCFGRLDIQRDLYVLEKYLEKRLKNQEEILEQALSYGKASLTTAVYFAEREIKLITNTIEACRAMQKEREARTDDKMSGDY